MATFHIPITPASTVGSSNFKVRYRLMGDSMCTSFLIPVPPTSGTTATVPQNSPISVLLNNRIYDFQVQNINGTTNDLSLISQSIGILFETEPTISPTSTTVGYSFGNLSSDMDSYTIQLTTVEDPGTIIASAIQAAGAFPGTISGQFTGLEQLSGYRLLITPVANQFSETFIYPFVTTATTACADVTNIIATLS